MSVDTERVTNAWPWGLGLSGFELAKTMVPLALQACRSFNTLGDVLFYNTPVLQSDLAERQVRLEERLAETPPKAGYLDLDAYANPEGSLLLVDPAAAPFITAFTDVSAYLADSRAATVATATVTGVGSSALGSAALAWDVAKGLRAPVLAIVPGYGVADLVLQALGGWFGFGLADAMQTKTLIQDRLADIDPTVAAYGRDLVATISDPAQTNGAPTFRRGSGSSDVLHDLLQRSPALGRLVGHSKGALVIGNAVRGLAPARTDGMEIVTLGCPIAAALSGARYHQYLGVWDGLGQLNAWGHRPTRWVESEHSTNMALPLSMSAARLVAGGVADQPAA